MPCFLPFGGHAKQKAEQTPKLFLAGKHGWEAEGTLDLPDRCISIRERVLKLASISNDLLSALVQNASIQENPDGKTRSTKSQSNVILR